ncbi:hypothetical protein CLAFUW4_10856 [Fulvia fulva]|uniref:Uncharacterized protein n=1 Tax=Passalora fulva TaxID=5499 RepID=A0A9Q8PD38_PASFU|nr:uncharacterized protein CLAFUR5_09898 [Fulvia fulva]KAK4619396.1 hypothetical protein CLAFUR4_10861 [Fulvia fulva]KAK4620877.1 hypothetical protein CLAFUR0_10868 [Fulvia fulva]UJO20248.1 hypothetical protein CLAFUR5_09898 [Fulvia fulva]WPV17547.1 hypothetical protein CLAFUW4_10856 [Fulvia fulva]WPV31937.1 hypothetical protein CLAFUW7_10854 [Fulvia fulva]
MLFLLNVTKVLPLRNISIQSEGKAVNKMGKRRASTGRQPPAKRTKPAPTPKTTKGKKSAQVETSSAPLDLQQYIGTFDDINYDQARRWCTYFGRKGRSGKLPELQDWLKEKYERHGKGPLDKPNDLPPSRSASPKSSQDSPGEKSPGSDRPGSREGATPDVEPDEAPKGVSAESSARPDASESVRDAWRLLRTAANILERDREHDGVEEALDQLKDVLYTTLANYMVIEVPKPPDESEAVPSAPSSRNLEAQGADLQRLFDLRAFPAEKGEGEGEDDDDIEYLVLKKASLDDDTDAIIARVREMETLEEFEHVGTYAKLVDLALIELRDDQPNDLDDGSGSTESIEGFADELSFTPPRAMYDPVSRSVPGTPGPRKIRRGTRY